VEDAVPPARIKQEGMPTVLIVEDHFMTRWSAAQYLRAQGYRVLEAVNFTEALGLANSGTRIDVVFSDVELGEEQSGLDLAAWFSKHRPYTPVLLTSGADRNDSPHAGGRPAAFVRKPYDLTQVGQMLRSMLERR